jgi:PAS domain S-box-containing protein
MHDAPDSSGDSASLRPGLASEAQGASNSRPATPQEPKPLIQQFDSPSAHKSGDSRGQLSSNQFIHPVPIERGQVQILMVDDRDDKLLALEVTLEPLGHKLVKAKSGKEALRLLLKQDYAVILLDVSMPGMDGFETAALIRQRPSSESTPIIFVTAISGSPNEMYQGYSLGAVDYILTPLVPDVLRAKVSVFVDLFLKTEQVRQQGERLRQMEEAQHKRELADAVDRLETETRRNRFFTLAVDMLGIADSNGYLIQVNPTWQKVLGYSEDELRSTSGVDLVHPEERPALLQHLENMRATGVPATMEARYRCKDGTYRWLGWTAAPFNAENLVYIFARDITARKTSEQEIQRLNVELQYRVKALIEVNRELESFNYSISHDLRAPLRSMQSFAQAVLEDPSSKLSAESLDFMGRVTRSGRYMDMLLQDLLTYSRLARAEFTPVPVDLDTVLRDVLNQLHKDIKDKQARIDILSPLGRVMGHQPTLKQVLANLIGNSLKFVAPETEPHIQVASARREDALRVTIHDNGIGIEPGHHKKIFGLFERLHSGQNYPGTGIGLALVRKGLERLGGEVGLESTPAQGSRFWFELPPAS